MTDDTGPGAGETSESPAAPVAAPKRRRGKAAAAKVIAWKPNTADVDAVVGALAEAMGFAQESGCTTAVILLVSRDVVDPLIVLPDDVDLAAVIGELEALKTRLVLELLDSRDDDDEDGEPESEE